MWETLPLELKLIIAGELDLKSLTNLMVSDSGIVKMSKKEEREEVTRNACLNTITLLCICGFPQSMPILDRYSGDRDIVLAVVQKHDQSLMYVYNDRYIDSKFFGDRYIVLESVKTDGSLLRYASEYLSGDRTIVLEAVKTSGNQVLQYASPELREQLKKEGY